MSLLTFNLVHQIFQSILQCRSPAFAPPAMTFPPPVLSSPVVLSRQQRRVQLMRIRQREERLKKEKENKKKKKQRQNPKSVQKQKTSAHLHHHPHHQQYHHPSASHPHHQAHSSQVPKVPPPQTEPGYHRKSNPKRRYDGDVLSPVRRGSCLLLINKEEDKNLPLRNIKCIFKFSFVREKKKNNPK